MESKVDEKFTLTDKIEHLVDAMATFHSTFNSNGYSSMGFMVVVVGWLITSKEARRFLHSHPTVIYASIIIVVLNSVVYMYMAFGLQEISQGLHTQLLKIPAAQGLYEHFLIEVSLVLGYLVILGMVAIVIIIALLIIRKDPALPTETPH